MKSKILYPDLSYKIVGICFKAYNEMGRFAREKQYGDLVETKLKEAKIEYKRELSISNTGNKVDFLIEDKVILELKTVRMITKEDYMQVQRYLNSTGIELGLLVNFRNKYLVPKRILRVER